MWVNRSLHWQRLCSRLTSWLAHWRDQLSAYHWSRLTKLIWIQIELNWIWWHRLFWLNWFTSFLKEKESLWFSSNQRSYVLVDSIDRVNRCYWMSDRFSSNSTVLSLILLILWCCSVFRSRWSSGKQISLDLFRCSSSVLNEYWYSYHKVNEFLV